VLGGAGRGVGDGARGLHLRSCGAAPEGCNASRDAYNSATPEREGGRFGPVARRGGSEEESALERPSLRGSLLLLLLLRRAALVRCWASWRLGLGGWGEEAGWRPLNRRWIRLCGGGWFVCGGYGETAQVGPGSLSLIRLSGSYFWRYYFYCYFLSRRVRRL
jgi:hypothetical protein